MKSTYEAYYEAPQAIKDVVDSELIGNSVEKILTDSQYLPLKSQIIIACTRYFLAVSSQEQLVGELRSFNLDEETISVLIAENQKLLNQTIENMAGDKLSPSPSDISSELAAAEAALATLPTIRTMNQTEPVYSSTQAAILREGGEVGAGSALPKTQPSEAPTWDSAR